MDKLKMQTANKVNENVERIAALFPNCVTESLGADGKLIRVVDFDLLRQELSGFAVEGQEERYQFTWADKKKSVLMANTSITDTLRPYREDSVNFDTTRNLYIEGDNLDVLKLLQETYMGKVKMIYIDPPYNTGADFVYHDNSAIAENELKERSGLIDESGNRYYGDEYERNDESNGRFHTDWLNMIYPRLKLAKDLLTDDGVIFISIDDNEIDNLKKVSSEVFGASNFICTFVRKNKAGSGHDSRFVAVEFDYVLCYARNISEVKINKQRVDIDSDVKYKLEDEFVKERGRFYLRDLDYVGSYSITGDYPLTMPDGTELWSGGKFGKPNTWRWSKKKVEWGLKNGFVVFKQINGNWKAYIKQYQFVDNNNEPYVREIPYRALIDFSNSAGTQECTELLGSGVFSFPKSTQLLIYFLKMASDKDSIILDFFSGSATTAHAVMQQNAEDGGNRRFILVQLPEVTPNDSEAQKAGYKTICDIGKERIRRAGAKLIETNRITAPNLDIGFRVLKVDFSNMKPVFYNPDQIEQSLFAQLEDNIKDDRTAEDLLFQVILDMGIDLSSDIKVETLGGKTVYTVGGDNLVCCFDEGVTKETVTEIAKRKPLYAIFRDSGFERDDTLVSFDQIFATYSPTTERRVI